MDVAPRLTLPPEQTGPGSWSGPEWSRRDDWIVELSRAEVDAIESAICPLVERQVDIAGLTRPDVPLPTLSPRLDAVRRELTDGRGFVLLRGLPVTRWSLRESATAYYALGLHLGAPRAQNARGHLLGHVQDMGLSSQDPGVRIYQTSERQTFHTDSCDVVGLLCLQPARSGGLSLLVSSITIFNEMRRRRPDLLALLFEPIATDKRGEELPGTKPFFEIPVFNWHRGALSAIYQRQYIDSAQRFEDAPRLTPRHVEALDLFDALANDPALNFSMELRPGDVQFLHNHTILHDRTAFTDWPEPARRRHLLRLWLAVPGARELPEVFAQRYGSTRIGDRGGVTLPDATRLCAPLEDV